MILKNIPILLDNYVWILYDTSGLCIIIDPGSSELVIQEIKKNKLNPIAILLTHDHSDHTNGVIEIIKFYPKIIIFGPSETKKYGTNRVVLGGDKIVLLDKTFHVFCTPGHTLGHVSYYSEPYLFCGDTVFSGGCGRVYKNEYLKMYSSIKLISSLPNKTILCCSHEYTLSNLEFCMFILPKDKNIKNYYEKIKKIINMGKPSLPSYIIFEKKVNIFFKTNEIYLRNLIGLKESCSSLEVFINLRLKKDNFFGAKRD